MAAGESNGSLTVLGCDGSYPGPGGAASGYLVEWGGVKIWLDAGAGTFAALQLVTDPGSLDAVVLSHEHPDHWSDVDSYAVWLRRADGRPPVPVYAPPGLRARSYFGDDRLLAWHEIDPSQPVVVPPPLAAVPHGPQAPAAPAPRPAVAGLRLSFSRTDHGPPTMAVRFELAATSGKAGGRAFGYTADTGPGWSPEELGPGIGLLLSEATYTQEAEGTARHLSARQAGALAAAAGVGRLVLTHRLPSIGAEPIAREAAEAFGHPVEQAAPGRVLRW